MQWRNGRRGRQLLLMGAVLGSMQACGGGGGGDPFTQTDKGTEQYALAVSPDGRTVASGGTFVVTTYGSYYSSGLGVPAGVIYPVPSDPGTPSPDPGPVENIPPDDPNPPDTSSGSTDTSASSSSDTSSSNSTADATNAGEGRKGHRRLMGRLPTSIPASTVLSRSRAGKLTTVAQANHTYTTVTAITPVHSARGQATVPLSNGRYVYENLNGRVWFSSAQNGTSLGSAALGQIIYALAYSPDGTQLASGSQDQILRLLDAQTGAIRQEFKGHGDRVSSVAFSSDGKRLISAGYNDHTVRVWDIASGALQLTVTTGKAGATAVAFAPDGKTVAGGQGDGTVVIWDAQTGAVVHTLKAHKYAVWTVAFSPDGKSLASGSADNKVNIWDTTTGSLHLTLLGHTNFVFGVRFSPDGKTLASGSADRSVKLWDTVTGALINTLAAPSSVQAVDYTPDSAAVVAAGVGGDVSSWDIPSGQLRWQQTVH